MLIRGLKYADDKTIKEHLAEKYNASAINTPHHTNLITGVTIGEDGTLWVLVEHKTFTNHVFNILSNANKLVKLTIETPIFSDEPLQNLVTGAMFAKWGKIRDLADHVNHLHEGVTHKFWYYKSDEFMEDMREHYPEHLI